MDFSLNFTPRIHQSIKIAKSLASSLHHNHITALHLFYGVSRVQETFFHYFSQDKFGLIDLHDFLKKQVDPETLPKNSEVYFSKDFKQSLKSAVKIANLYDHDYIGIEHLLIPLLKTKEVINFCSQYNIYSNDISKEVEKSFKVSIDSHNFNIEHTKRDKTKYQINKYVTPTPDNSISHKNNPHELHIDSLPFCENFEVFASKGQFRNLLFDESKPQEVIEILSRKSKNNPLIIGDPGIGKTALIEYLSQLIYDKKVPDFLIGKKIISLNLGGLVAGTKYRGQFEERLKDLVKLLSNNHSYILFIDEIHSLCGIGQAEGGMDAANLLKPALSRGDITCIGATTYKEYQTYLSKDSALCRRFQNVTLNEPSQSLCVKMLNSIMLDYEDYHHIKFRKNAIQSAVKLSSRYIHDRHLPDKAIDLLDECAAKIKLLKINKPNKIVQVENAIEKLMDENSDINESDLSAKLDSQFSLYQDLLDKWNKSLKNNPVYVSEKDVQELISSKTGIPFDIVSSSADKKFLNLKNKLSSCIFGQDEAINVINNSILRSACGLQNQHKPLGSFMFLGKTGTGKTFVAKKISEFLFGGEKSLIRLDMGEFSESSSVSKLTGSSPGYIGYGENNFLIDSVSRNPYSVILFDEIEKAHPEVLKVLLSVLDEGYLTNSSGKKVSFLNCLIIFTGNLGSDMLDKNQGGTLGFAQSSSSSLKDKISELVKKEFSPEFFNRLDDLVVFNSFCDEDYKSIINTFVENLNFRLKGKLKNVSLDKSVFDFFISELKKLNLGARPVERLFKNHIENLLAKSLLQKKILPESKIVFSINKSGEIIYN